ncbi:MAG: LTA synthase family protein [Opitutaceae bacterium]|nr:LTA synthase family protein [Opitutaceae bacterium]
MLTTATIVGLLLIPIRAKTVGYPFWATLVGWRDHLATAVMTACYDIAFVTASAVLFAALLLPRARRWVQPVTAYRMHMAFSVVTLIDCLSNIPVVPWLGQPFNFQWLYYADFLRSPDAISSILATVPLWKMGLVFLGAVGFVVAVMWTGALVSRGLESRRARLVALGTLTVVTATYLAFSFRWRHREGWSDDILVNPVWAFAESCLRALVTPPLLQVETPYTATSFAPPPAPETSLLPDGRATPRHVIVFVMESVGAPYVGLYGAPYGVTPVLDSQRSRAAVFTRAYAHAPATNLTLVALMTGRYPRVSFRPITTSNPTIAVPHLSKLMRDHGYATGFFSSASLEFQRADEFLAAGRGFDRIEDEDARPEAAARALEKWSDFVGTDDESTVDSLIAWADSCGDKPFFGVMWTAQSHFPYYPPDNARQISDKSPEFNRYLNAISEGDRALGRLMAWLDASGRADDTLVVVLGDHGQAFGQHKTFGHAGHTWEEHLRIPLVLINQRLFSGQTFDTVCGVSDIAPTITEVLHLPDLPGFQGRSLFRTDRPNTLYFFAAWSDFLVGYREGDIKVVYNMTKDFFRVHDLAKDPLEKNDIAASMPDFTADARLRLAGWMQWVDGTYAEAEAATPEP